MSNNSDFKKPRTNLHELLPEILQSDVNRSLFENVFNKHLSKSELTKVVGTIGLPTGAEQIDPRIRETTPHREAFQLQPLVYANVATVDHLASWSDILRELERNGVDINRLPKWGNAQSFNFAPPIDVDKFVNYSNYFWWDEDNLNSTPQYITIRSRCAVAKARITQKLSEINQLNAPIQIQSIDAFANTITINGNFVEPFAEGVTFVLDGSDVNDGVFTSSTTPTPTLGKTVISVVEPLSATSQLGNISFGNQIFELQQQIAILCLNSLGWDTTLWDDNQYPDPGSPPNPVSILEALQDRLTDNNLSQFSGLTDPEQFAVDYIDGNYNFDNITLWDQSDIPVETNSWIKENKWIHRLDLPERAIGQAIRGTMPILEYADTVQLNSWILQTHNWMYRPGTGSSWKVSSVEPTNDDIFVDLSVDLSIKPSFYEQWAYVSANPDVPTAPPELATSRSIQLTTNTTETNLLLDKQPDNKTFLFPIEPIGNPTNPARTETTLAGTNNIRVYKDGVRTYGGYEEVTHTVSGIEYVKGISFTDSIANDVLIQVGLSAPAEQDVYRDSVVVRTQLDDNTFASDFDNNTKTVSLIRYRKAEQVKGDFEPVYPLFDLYRLDGTSANKVSHIFGFREDNNSPVNPLVKKRIITDGTNFEFEQLLIEEDNGHMFMYKDRSSLSLIEENPEGFQTIWRTSNNPSAEYVPKFVDKNRRENGEVYFDNSGQEQTAVVTAVNGDWEVAQQLIHNPAHDNRKNLSYAQLVTHFQSIIATQELPPSYFLNSGDAVRLLYDIDYGVGGTIKEYNDGFDKLISSAFLDKNTPLTILEYANDQYDNTLTTLKELFRSDVVNFLLKDSEEFMVNQSEAIAEDIITQYELNDYASLVFGDSNTYTPETDKGVKNFILTLPYARLSKPDSPCKLYDDKLGIKLLRHHDGHVSITFLTQNTINSIQNTVVNTIITPGRLRGWKPGVPADGNTSVSINTFADIPANRLLKNDYWLNGSDFYRFEVVAIQSTAPGLHFKNGTYWLRSSDGQLHIRNASYVNGWEPVGVAGDTTPAWKPVLINELLQDVIVETETRLFDNVPESETLAWTEDQYILDSEDQVIFDNNMELFFLEWARERNIIEPYASDFNPADAFTWNYSGVTVSSTSVYFPIPKDESLWASRWHTIYDNVYGTSFPHLEPWKLQQFQSKPTWWDEEYKGTTRRWSTTMWSNIKNGIVPSAYTAPEGTMPQYSFVCVNTTDNTTSDGFGPDDLLPPYWIPPTGAPEDIALINEVFIRTIQLITSADISTGYVFGDQGPIEWLWRLSSAFKYDTLKTSYKLQPMRFMHYTFGTDYIYRGKLNLDPLVETVPNHSRTVFHGDMVDSVTRKIPGLNQWYINFNRTYNLDNKNSDFRELWTKWNARFSYQADSYLDPRSLNIVTKNFSVEDINYNVLEKRAPGIQDFWLDSLQVTVTHHGASKPRRNVKIPKFDGSDWSFVIDGPIPVSRNIYSFGVKNYPCTVSNLGTSLFQSTSSVNLETGEIVSMYGNGDGALPVPLRDDVNYYIIKETNSQFKLATTAQNAADGVYIELSDAGIGSFQVKQPKSSFFALGGENTGNTWYHHSIDTTVTNSQIFPIQITGIQNVIDFIDGYKTYLETQNFVFNDSDNREYDPDTGRLVDWQLEVERFVDTVYVGLGINNVPSSHRGQMTQFAVDLPTSTINVNVGTMIPRITGQEVYLFANGALPTGLLMNTPYYIIDVDASNGRYKLASSVQNATDEIAIVLTDIGAGSLFLGVFEELSFVAQRFHEINPFRNNVWFSTQYGVVSNVVSGPAEDFVSERLIYDQYGRALAADELRVYRQDKKTRINVLKGLENDVIPNKDPYNNIHIGGTHIFVDGYEHVIMFDNYTTDGLLIFDAFLGLSVRDFNVRFDRQESKVGRPSVGGFFNLGSDIIRNMEASVGDMQDYYDTYGVREAAEYLEYARDLLGYENPSYLDLINATDKSKFIFWKGMIQHKGSRNAITAFINSRRFVDAKVDEFWAYKLTNFGDSREQTYPEINLHVSDTVSNDMRFEFKDVADAENASFRDINFDDESRWVDLPEIKASFPSTVNTIWFDAEVTNQLQVEVDTSSSTFYDLVSKSSSVRIFTSSGIELIKDTDFTIINARVVKFKIEIVDLVTVYQLNPAYDKLSPVKIIDTNADVTVSELFAWDPIVGRHDPQAYNIIDLEATFDPVHFNLVDNECTLKPDTDTDGLWSEQQVGTVWWDTSNLRYVPYYDKNIFPAPSLRLSNWGKLADDATINLYEWTKSPVPPSEYNTIVEEQEGDATIENNDRASGIPKKTIFFNGERICPEYLTVEHSAAIPLVIDGNRAPFFTPSRIVNVYVNGISTGQIQFSEYDSSQYFDQDIITLVVDIASSANEFTEEFDFITVERYDDFGQTLEPEYFFWVGSKTVRQHSRHLSLQQAESLLLSPSSPYMVIDNFKPAVEGKPDHFDQLILRQVSSLVSSNNRFTLQMLRDFTLRDKLSNENLLKDVHTEWMLFREDTSVIIPEALWTAMTNALVGFDAEQLELGKEIPVPAADRRLFDATHGTTTQYGLRNGQAFVNKTQGLATVFEAIRSTEFDTGVSDKDYFINNYTFDTPLNIKTALDFIYVNFPSTSVNKLFFAVLNDALSNNKQYPDLFKTSMVALHGIKLIETPGTL